VETICCARVYNFSHETKLSFENSKKGKAKVAMSDTKTLKHDENNRNRDGSREANTKNQGLDNFPYEITTLGRVFIE